MFIKDLLDFLTKWFNNEEKKETKQIEIQKVHASRLLEDLYEVIQENLLPFNIFEFIRLRKDFRYNKLHDQIRITNYREYNEEITTIMRLLPGARISERHIEMAELWIEYDKVAHQLKLLSSTHVLYDTSLNLKSLINFLSHNQNPLFNNLLIKYEDTFYNLNSTIREMVASGSVSGKTQVTIKKTLDVIITEFLSLKLQLDTKKKLDEEAIAKSLEQRIEDELTLVDIIKTNWSN